MGDIYIFDIPISIGTMLYQAFIFSALVFVVYKLCLKKVINMLDERRQYILQQLKEVEQYKREAKSKYLEQMKELEEAKKEVKQMRENSNKQALYILNEAKKEANELRKRADEGMEGKKGA